MPSTHVNVEGSWGSCNANADGKRSDRSLATDKTAYVAEKALKYTHDMHNTCMCTKNMNNNRYSH